MDKTQIYFANYYKISEEGSIRLEILRRALAELTSAADVMRRKELKMQIKKAEAELEAQLIEAAKQSMHTALSKDLYNLTIDDVKDVLDCDDRFVADYILPHVDYIDVPKYSGHYFNNNFEFSCVDQIRLIWKKVFINKNSFIDYLLANASLKYVYYTVNADSKRVKCIAQESLDMFTLNTLLAEKTLFRRRCNLGHVIMNVKFASFVERIVAKYNDLFKKALLSQQLGEFDIRRLSWELDNIKQLTPEKLRLKVRTKEITDYIQQHAHVELIINCPGVGPRMAVRSDLEGKEVEGRSDTSTTLYSLNCVLVEDYLKNIDAIYSSALERFE